VSDDDSHIDRLTSVVREACQRIEQGERRDQETLTVIEHLVNILVGRGILNEGHKKNLQRMRESAPASERKVRLTVIEDKYLVPNSDIDCASRIHICQARCCTFAVPLSRQDVEQRVVQFEIDEPYLLRHDRRDGRCVHQDKKTGFCLVHHHRPALCRSYDCRHDRRIWEDFDKQIPAAEIVATVPKLES
jgi:Fe-S-cluster containining protein